MDYSRRTFLATGLAASVASAEEPPSPIDFRKLISRADLVYDKPMAGSEEGIPIGNGRMGSLVWTAPSQLRLQINRADVYANDCTTNSFFERHDDYCGGCGYVDIGFAGEPFPETGFAQRLSIYDGVLNIGAKDAAVRVLASPSVDTMAVIVNSRGPAEIALRMLRYDTKYFGQQLKTFVKEHIVTVRNRNHTAASRLVVSGGRIALVQEFREGGFCCKSAVAITIIGRPSKAWIRNETDVAIAAEAGAGEFTILISSAATFDPAEDVLGAALGQLAAAESAGAEVLVRQTRNWWHAFWERSFVSLHSDDGVADFVEQHYHYFQYIMASSSRGKFPPKFNRMLWNTGGDLRTWGAQHWYANTSCYCEAIPTTGRWELMDPFYAMYSAMYENCCTAARQQRGSRACTSPRRRTSTVSKNCPTISPRRCRSFTCCVSPGSSVRPASWSMPRSSTPTQAAGTGFRTANGKTGAGSLGSAASALTEPSRTSSAALPRSHACTGAAMTTRWIANGCVAAPIPCCARPRSFIATIPM